jgi:aspartyl-tRNA(Asn)/glutamyl-tRNA(Gln) amidotransferase subunit C
MAKASGWGSEDREFKSPRPDFKKTMKKIISKDLIKSLSKLAKINLTEKEVEKYTNEFSSVIGYMEEIKNIDVENISETARVSDEGNIFRKDEIKPSLSQEQALKNCKNTYNGYFLVPKILKDN